MHEILDQHDYKRLLLAILKQALDDYIKLQHPKYRKKKYLMEAFQDAIDMFFDNEYRMLNLQNEQGLDMSLQDLVGEILGKEDPEIKLLQEYLVDEALRFWDAKKIKTLDIPETIQIGGHVYRVIHKELEEPHLDLDDKIITLDKEGPKAEEHVVLATTQLILYHEGIPLANKHTTPLAKAWFRALKLNNCFSGAY